MADESPRRRVNIRVPDTYRETNAEVWSDLETLLFQGFLTTSSHILGRTYVFKTLNHAEIRYLDFLRPLKSSPPTVRASFRASFIAHSVFMIDGQNAIFERPRHLHRLIKTISKMDAAVQEKIVQYLSAINARAARLYPMVEVYIWENRSRFRWLQMVSTPVHSPLLTGVPGTDEIGMNYCQGTWTALNRLIDRREEMERDWQNAKFIGSCFNGKGVRAVDERDKARATREKSDREDLKMKVLYRYLNRLTTGEEPAELIDLPDGRQAQVVERFRADSADELAEQLSAALSGERDYHDLVVEKRTQELRDRGRELEERRRQIYASGPQLKSLTGDGESGTQIIGSKSDADAYVSRMEALKLDSLEKNRRFLSPDLHKEKEPDPTDS